MNYLDELSRLPRWYRALFMSYAEDDRVRVRQPRWHSDALYGVSCWELLAAMTTPYQHDSLVTQSIDPLYGVSFSPVMWVEDPAVGVHHA